MSLQDFFQNRPACPLCQGPVLPAFLSNKRKISLHDDSWCSAQLLLTPTRIFQDNYKITIYFHLLTQSFYIDCYQQSLSITLDNIPNPINEIPNDLVLKIHSLFKTIKPYKFFTFCNLCSKYSSSSNIIDFDFKKQSFSTPTLDTEVFWFRQQVNDNYVVIKLVNYYKNNNSDIYYGKFPSEDFPRWDIDGYLPKIKTTLIKVKDQINIDKLIKIVALS